ncbi:ATP-binding protein [Desulfovibrio litoralis]|uniref:4Fe-4S binding domain-containing protein n=1 Tax=Desulfovibrio litoralis DSM 11393 TaxID=1121455 RepID=A0A1M7T3B3_9BACT|nr:4Fe-4S dicluster domain-containing protein [Desulfovibrio litoralis]SHN65198.1 4Fe-4S binding domain-containing protein [Desulfovibrio litoralis DSM 11393]
MSKVWYPEINNQLCTECGACLEKCKHGVYDQTKTRPVVIYPEGCITNCRGCQELCPSKAISYFGDIFKDHIPCCCG